MGSANNQQHVALIAFPFASHPGNLFAFARALAAAAPDVTFSFLTTAFATATLPPVPPAANLLFRHVADGVPEGGLPPGTTIHGRIGMFLRATPGNFRDGLRAAEEEVGAKVSCVVTDAFLWMAADVAEDIGARWLPLWTCAPAALLAHVATDQLRERFGVEKQATPGWADELVDFVPGLACLRIRDIPDEIITDHHSDLSLLLHRMGSQLTTAAAVTLNTFDGLDPTIDSALAAIFKKTLPIGPLNLLSPPPPLQPGDEKCLAWLDGQEEDATVAYVSFGTMVLMPTQSDVAEIAGGLETSGVKFLWALREEARAGMLPPGFLERTAGRGMVVPWAPQVRVLAHRAVGAFVTHCGWNAVMESVTSGVPMACLPSFADQKANARMVSVWGIGEALRGEKVTREEVVRSVEIVMRGEEGRRMRERIGKLRVTAEEAVGPGGSSSENFKNILGMVRGIAD